MREIYETIADVPGGVMVKSNRFYVIKSASDDSVVLATALRNGKQIGWINHSNPRGPFKELKK